MSTPNSTTEPMVTSNDNTFNCRLASCSDTLNYGITIGGCSTASSFLRLNAQYMNMEELRAAILESSRQLGDRVDEYKSWIETKEAMFESSYMFNDINANVELFNKVNNVIGRLRQGLKILNGWYGNMQSLEARVLDDAESYDKVRAVINTLELLSHTQMYATGLPVNTVDVAKSNLTRSKSINRQLSRILAAEVRLRGSLTEYESEIGSFNRNVIRYNGKILDLKELGKLVDSLSDNETPLNRVQKSLATLINNNTVDYNYKATTPSTRGMEVKRKTLTANIEGGPTRDKILKNLNELERTKIYTAASSKRIEEFFNYVHKMIASNADAEIEQLINKIRRNTFDVVKNDLSIGMENSDLGFQTIVRINDLIENLDSADRLTYEAPLKELLQKAQAIQLTNLSSQQ